ncbi:O-antigen ligase family protein [Caviibacter abscessus]|uniref:O-antigen ligase family protein n=1 Tax=Caviibacter abscessus TaxID=1766719 RepID=UPI00083776F7|nr:O-antigen ligase family protein [Caviibacter abscessus]
MEAREDKVLLTLIYFQALLLGISYKIAIFEAVILVVYFLLKGYRVSLNNKQIYATYILILNSTIALYYKNYIGILINTGLIFFFFVYNFYILLDENIKSKIENIVLYSSLIVNLIYIIYFIMTKQRVGAFSYFNPNYYGSYLTFIVIMSLIKGKKYLTVSIISILAILATGSRFSLIAILLALSAYIFFYFKKYFVVFFSALTIYFIGVYKGIFPFIRTDSIEKYLKLRIDIWYMAIKFIKTNWLLGHGPGYFYYITNYVYAHTHSILLEPVLSYGLLGIIILLILYLYKLKINKIKAIVLILIFVHGLADYTILWYQTILIYMIVFNLREEICNG